MTLYISRTSIEGRVGVQQVVSILWYTVESTGITPLVLGQEVNETVFTEIMPSWRPAVHSSCTIVSLVTNILDTTWANMTPGGVVRPYGAIGTMSGTTAGAAHALHLKATIDRSVEQVGPAGNNVKRGRVFIGPITDGAVGPNDELVTAGFGGGVLTALKAVLAQGYAAHGLITGDMHPIRTSFKAVSPGVYSKSWARISAWTEDYYAAHLDSRGRDN